MRRLGISLQAVRGGLSAAFAFVKRHARALRLGLFVLVLLALCVLFALVDNTVIGYLPLLLVLLLLVLMPVYVLALSRGIELEEGVQVQTCQRGDVVDVAVNVRNRTWLLAPRIEVSLFISNLQGDVDAITRERFALLPHEARELTLSARFDHVGEYQVGIHALSVFDLLGIFCKRRRAFQHQEVLVMPRIVEIKQLSVSQEQMCDSSRFRQSVVSDGYDYVGMREYELGDSMKNVHWKASARFEQLLTRVRERQINPGICIVADRCTQWPNGEELMCMYDAIIESTLSLASYARENGIECSVAMLDSLGQTNVFESMRQWDYADLLQAMPRLEPPSDTIFVANVLREASAGLHSASNIIVCSSNLSDELVSSMIAARMQRKNVLFVYARPKGLDDCVEHDIAKSLSRLGQAQVSAFVLSDSAELQGGEL